MNFKHFYMTESPDYYKSSDSVLNNDYIEDEYKHNSDNIIEEIKKDSLIYKKTRANDWFIVKENKPIAIIKISPKDSYCSIIISVTNKEFRGQE